MRGRGGYAPPRPAWVDDPRNVDLLDGIDAAITAGDVEALVVLQGLCRVPPGERPREAVAAPYRSLPGRVVESVELPPVDAPQGRAQVVDGPVLASSGRKLRGAYARRANGAR